jgi:protein phosphatase
VTDEEIGLFAAELEPTDATAALVGLALVRGAPDNVTVIVARAGAEEVSSKAAPGDEPWALTEEPVAATGRAAVPWKWLALAAGSLFAALVLLSNVEDINAVSQVKGEVKDFVALFLAGAAGLTFLGSLLAAFLGFMAPAGGNGRALLPGQRLGKGPYRTYDCTPTEGVVERIVASIETAAAGLADTDRERTTAILGRVRRHVAERAFHEAVVAIAEAIAIYTRAVEQSRSGDTIRGPAPTDT